MSEPLDRLCSELRIKLHGTDRKLEKDNGRLHCSTPGPTTPKRTPAQSLTSPRQRRTKLRKRLCRRPSLATTPTLRHCWAKATSDVE
jgi:hypothetical protein